MTTPQDEHNRVFKRFDQNDSDFAAFKELTSQELADLKDRVKHNEKALALIVDNSVAEGIKRAVSDPETWNAFFKALGSRAQNQAGEVAVGGVKWLAQKILWGLIAGAVVYAVGGFTLVSSVLKALLGKGN